MVNVIFEMRVFVEWKSTGNEVNLNVFKILRWGGVTQRRTGVGVSEVVQNGGSWRVERMILFTSRGGPRGWPMVA